MNKYLFILGLVGTALFSACSADDLTTVLPPEEEEAIVVEAGKDSDVPIALGARTERGMTRAPLDPVGAGNFETTDGQFIGEFCLASGRQTGAPSVVPNDNSIYWNTHPYATWMDNVPATVSSSGVVEFKDSTTLSELTPTDKTLYYPFGNWYHYDFFAYYPRQAGKYVWVGQGRVDVDFTIDGSQDIIVGKALGSDQTAINGVKAYSAKYMQLGGEKPIFEFSEHKLTQLVFYVKPQAGYADALYTNSFQLTGLKIINVYNKLVLYAASKGDNYGNLIIKNDSTQDLPVCTDMSGVYSSMPFNIAISDDDENKKLVGYAMLPPSDLIASRTNNTYQVTIEGTSSAGAYSKQVTLAGPFEAGKKYEIVLEIKNRDE